MRSIDVKDLQERTAKLLREVREKEALYVFRSGGKPVAVLSPLTTPLPEKGADAPRARAAGDGWERYARLGERLRETWPPDRASDSLLAEVRGTKP